MSMFERVLRGLAGPVVRRAPAADSMTVFRQADSPPPAELDGVGNLLQQEWLAPSLGVRAIGLPEVRMPDFGGVTFYLDPEVLNNSRLYGNDVWTPRGTQVDGAMHSVLAGRRYNDPFPSDPSADERREAAALALNSMPIRNGESPISVEYNRIAAGLAPEFRTPQEMAEALRAGRLVTDGSDTTRPFQDFDTFRDQLFPYNSSGNGQPGVSGERMAFNRRVHDALNWGGRDNILQRDAPDAPERTLERMLEGLNPIQRGMLESWVRTNQDMPTRYAEAKYMGFLPNDAIVAATAPAGDFRVRLMEQALERGLPTAPTLNDLPPAVLRRLAFGAGGLGAWMPTLGGGDE